MKANELIVGCWVTSKKWREKPFKITRINDSGKYYYGITAEGSQVGPFLIEELEPIPLTAEILDDNGFKIRNEDTDGAIQYEYGSRTLGIDIWINTKPCLLGAWRTWKGETKSYTMVEELPINYVHELQHALRLCGIEKEIEL